MNAHVSQARNLDPVPHEGDALAMQLRDGVDIILSARDLCKRYKKVEAVRGIRFDVVRGTCVGLLGPNGAGKSTTIEMLEGLVQPSSGSILYNGKPLDRGYREHVGIVFQNTALQDNLSVRETLKFFAGLYRNTRDLKELSEMCLLGEFLDRYPRNLSGGQRQRLLLAIALVNDPRLIFLDEPTTGLDPRARMKFWELLGEIKRSGVTIILSTHYMEEAVALCDSIAIMDHGQIVASGSPNDLLSRHFEDSLIELPISERSVLLAHGIEHCVDGTQATIRTADVEATIEGLQVAGVSFKKLRVRAGTLEELYLNITGWQITT